MELHRKEARRQKYESAAGIETAGVADGDGNPAWEEVRPVLDDAINRLGERDRQAILLRYFANRPFCDIGERLKLSENAARMRVERALEKLHVQLVQRGIKSSSAALAIALSGNAIAAAPVGVASASASAAMLAAGGSGVAWIAFLSTAKLPISLTAVLIASGATIVGLQGREGARAAAEAAELSGQSQEIAHLKVLNQGMADSVSHANDLRDLKAQIRIIQGQLGKPDSEEEDSDPYASANQRLKRGTPPELDSSESSIQKFHQQPRLLTQTRPEYPAELKNLGTAGEVVVDLLVDKSGAVKNAYAVSSTDKAFEDAAIKAVSQWVFQPGEANGHPVFTHLQVPIVFTPTAGAPAPTAGSWF
jgi:TonB family protein